MHRMQGWHLRQVHTCMIQVQKNGPVIGSSSCYIACLTANVHSPVLFPILLVTPFRGVIRSAKRLPCPAFFRGLEVTVPVGKVGFEHGAILPLGEKDACIDQDGRCFYGIGKKDAVYWNGLKYIKMRLYPFFLGCFHETKCARIF